MKYRFLCALLLMTSANPAFMVFGKEIVYLVPFCIFLMAVLVRKLRPTKDEIMVLSVFAILSVIHFGVFGNQVISASGGFLIKILVAICATKVIKGFSEHFVRIMYYCSLISLVFYLLIQIGGYGITQYLSDIRAPIEGSSVFHIWIHNFHLSEVSHRNSGMFGEPGMFVGYLILSMLFLLKDNSKFAKRALIVIAVTILTTQSTTGYLALFVFIYMYVTTNEFATKRKKSLVALPAAIIALVTLGFVAYTTIPFLRDKIDFQWKQATSGAEGSEINRIGNWKFDVKYITERPLTGWSPRNTTRGGVDSDILEVVSSQGNGFSGFVVRFGIVGLLCYLYFTWKAFSTKYQNNYLGLCAVGIISILLFGEQFLNTPIFLALMFFTNSPALNPLTESDKRSAFIARD